MNIYAGHFQDSTFFKKSFFKEHLWIAASVKSSTFTRWTFRKKILKLINIESKNYGGQTFIIKTDFYGNTYFAINKSTPF